MYDRLFECDNFVGVKKTLSGLTSLSFDISIMAGHEKLWSVTR